MSEQIKQRFKQIGYETRVLIKDDIIKIFIVRDPDA